MNWFARLARFFDRDRSARLASGTLDETAQADAAPDEDGGPPTLSLKTLDYILKAAEAGAEREIDTPQRVDRAVKRLRAFSAVAGQSAENDEALRRLLLDIRGVDDETPAILKLLREQTMPELARLLRSAFDGPPPGEDAADNLLFILQILAGFRTVEAARLIAEAARAGVCADNGLWTTVQEKLLDDDAVCRFYFDALRRTSLQGTIRDNLLYVSVQSRLMGYDLQSPFDSPEGLRLLESWLAPAEAELTDMAFLAAYDLASLETSERFRLCDLADRHPNVGVRLNAAWSRAKLGDRRGLELLRSHLADADPETRDEAEARLRSLQAGA